MSAKAKFYRLIDEVIHEPGGAAILAELVPRWEAMLAPVVAAARAGDQARMKELLDDWEAKTLLQSALPDWGWGDVGAGGEDG